MYERREPDWRWDAELTWWHAWLDEHLGEGPDADEDPLGDYLHRTAFRYFWGAVVVRGRARDEDDLLDLLDEAWDAAFGLRWPGLHER